MTADETLEMGAEILRRERAFNEKAGFTKADDRLPEFMYTEALPPHNVRAEISGEVLDTVFGEM
jgi:aldehyde:ferredoxin oxidoreductase